MATFTRLKYLYLAYFSKPAAERTLYRLVRRIKPRKIVEIGIGSGLRAVRMIQLARGLRPGEQISYAGIDLFETRTGGGGLSIKQAYRLLKPTKARVQLVPGDPYIALTRAANALRHTDLVIVSADQDKQALAQAWFYFPRMLQRTSQVLIEIPGPTGEGFVLKPLERKELDRRAAAPRRRRAA